MVGDALSDIEFGRNLGMTTIFIEGDTKAREKPKTGEQRAAE
jgi:phosphoglycolate phosphatase-like HAD superfamily hydrolase